MDDLEFNADDLDFSAFEAPTEAVTQDQTEQVTPEEVGTGINPAWNPYLKDVPEGLHDMVTPAFKAWDEGVQKRFQEINDQWAPFQRFRDAKIEPDYIERSIGLAQQLQQDPVGVYQALNQFFQQSPQHLQRAIELGLIPNPNAAQAPEASSGELSPEDPMEKIAKLEQQLQDFQKQQLETFQRQQEEVKFNETYQATVNQIEQDFSQIEQTLKRELPGPVKAEIIKHAQFMGQQQGRFVSVIEAAPHVFQFMQQARAGIRKAPNPVGSGTIPQPPNVDPATASKEDRINMADAIFDRISQQG